MSIKWPEPKKHNFCEEIPCTCGAFGANLMLQACKDSYEATGLRPLDKKSWDEAVNILAAEILHRMRNKHPGMGQFYNHPDDVVEWTAKLLYEKFGQKPAEAPKCDHDWAWSNNAGKYYCQKCNDWSYLGNHSNFQVAKDACPKKPAEVPSVEEIEDMMRTIQAFQIMGDIKDPVKLLAQAIFDHLNKRHC